MKGKIAFVAMALALLVGIEGSFCWGGMRYSPPVIICEGDEAEVNNHNEVAFVARGQEFGNKEIHLRNSEGLIIRVTNTRFDNWKPLVSPTGNIVFLGLDSTGSNHAELYKYFKEFDKVLPVTKNSTADVNNLQFNKNGYMAWDQTSGGKQQIFLGVVNPYTEESTITRVSDASYDNWGPSISDNPPVGDPALTWQGLPETGKGVEILARFTRLQDPLHPKYEMVRITNNWYNDLYPQMSPGSSQIAFGGNYGVFTYGVENEGVVTRQLSDVPQDTPPRISSERNVAWHCNGEVFFFDFATKSSSRIFQGTGIAELQANENNQIVWEASANGVTQIFVWKPGEQAIQLTSGASHRRPRINNLGTVVCVEERDGKTYVCVITPEPKRRGKISPAVLRLLLLSEN